MIISHARKFIFVKTAKTAGTSLELALSKYCEPGDILTPLLADEEKERTSRGGLPPQGYEKSWKSLSVAQRAKRLLLHRRYPDFDEHTPAWEIKSKLPADQWESYYKFTIVRHPYDRIVSGYYWSIDYMTKHNWPRYYEWEDFDQYIRYQADHINYNWKYYTLNDNPIVDFAVRFESFEEDLAIVSDRIGLDHNIYDDMKSIRAKSGFRPKSAKATSILKDRHKALIAVLCRREMELYGYTEK